VASKSTFTNCSLARCETPSSRFQQRRREMDEIEHFLKKDSLKFGWITRRIQEVSPGPERNQLMDEFWTWVWKFCYYKDERALIRGRCREVCRFIALYDEELSDISGIREEEEPCSRLEDSCYYVSNKGWAHSSHVPYNLGQCERTSGPSHVVDGGRCT
jgi:hypothetical protein